MTDDTKRRSRLRWVTLGEAVAVAAVIISGLGLWNNYQDRREARAEKAAEASRATAPTPFHLRAGTSADGATLALSPVGTDHVIQGQTLRFPPSFKLSPVSTTSDTRIEASWFASALKDDRHSRQLPEETQGDERVPVMIETEYLAGDKALKHIALEIMAAARVSDFTYRFGGEEFVIITDGVNADDALALGERIRRRVAGATAGAEPDARLTVSIGIATCPRDGKDYDALFETADKRLYKAKADGRNRVVGGDNSIRLVQTG